MGPKTCASKVGSSGRSFFMENVTTFLPFAMMTVDAADVSFRASVRPSFALASTVSLIAIRCAARNPCALAQDFHPLR